jgi:ubiquinone/menaquinone biosynthesis C-methylase UbiE
MFKKNKIIERKELIQPFLSGHYQQHNIARLRHLESLELDLRNKKVLEFGSGIGDHSIFYLHKGCEVVASDARIELVEYLKDRLAIDCIVFDAEKDLYKLKDLPSFDIIHCYGILYHLSNPKPFLESISSKANLLLLETCVSPDHCEYGPHIVQENKKDPTQAISGMGCRPVRKWIFDVLKDKFNYVYLPKTQPNHPEFPKIWTEMDKQESNGLIRAVFIASQIELLNENLTERIIDVFD